MRDIVARAIWMKKPDAGGMNKPWPLDGKTPKERRTGQLHGRPLQTQTPQSSGCEQAQRHGRLCCNS